MKGATPEINRCGLAELVSIHAPVKGATSVNPECRDLVKVSIHAPVKGATAAYDNYAKLMEFQSTPP